MILALPARAKLNLELRVLGARPDGYHDIDTVVQTIDLHDLVEAEPASQMSLGLSGLPAPGGEANLILQAARLVESSAGRQLPTRFHLHKRIPSGAGLGGGSSDAAAVLMAMTSLYGLDLELGALAAQLGSDVPFLLRGGAARASGRGERLAPTPSLDAWFAVAWPGYPVSTAAVYSAWADAGEAGANQLQAAAIRVEPRLSGFVDQLGPGWQMTGSGSAFFRPFADCRQARAAIGGLACWTAVSRSVAGW